MKNEIKILMYHGIIKKPLDVRDWCFLDESSFIKQAKFLKQHFDIISLSEAVDLIKNRKITGTKVVITFDDGFQNNYDVAFKILSDLELPATIFIVSGLVNTTKSIWYCLLNHAISETRKKLLSWDDERFDLSDTESKSRSSSALQTMLKRYPQNQLIIYLNGILEDLEFDILDDFEPGSPYRILDTRSIKDMVSSNIIEFGAHTESHSILSLISRESQKSEIRRSIDFVSDVTGNTCKFFSYPNGQIEDYDNHTINILKQSNIIASVTAQAGNNDSNSDLMQLRRYGIGANISIKRFKDLMVS